MVTRTILVAALLAAVSHAQQAVAPNQPVPFRLLAVTPAQLAIYRHVLEAEGTQSVIAELVHVPFAGKIVECVRVAGA